MKVLLAALAATLVLAFETNADEIHHHPGKSPAVDRFYATWMKPDRPTESCCNRTDCDEAEMRLDPKGGVWAKRKRDALFRFVPPAKFELNRDSPDGRNHLCAPNWNAHEVYCFVAGIGG